MKSGLARVSFPATACIVAGLLSAANCNGEDGTITGESSFPAEETPPVEQFPPPAAEPEPDLPAPVEPEPVPPEGECAEGFAPVGYEGLSGDELDLYLQVAICTNGTTRIITNNSDGVWLVDGTAEFESATSESDLFVQSLSKEIKELGWKVMAPEDVYSIPDDGAIRWWPDDALTAAWTVQELALDKATSSGRELLDDALRKDAVSHCAQEAYEVAEAARKLDEGSDTVDYVQGVLKAIKSGTCAQKTQSVNEHARAAGETVDDVPWETKVNNFVGTADDGIDIWKFVQNIMKACTHAEITRWC